MSQEKLKIAIIGTTYPYRGGLASYNERLARELQDQGHHVQIYTFTMQYPGFLFPGKTQYSEDPAPKDLQIERSIHSANPINWYTQGRRIQKADYDLVIIKFWLPFMGPAFGTILRQIKKNKKTKIITIIDNIIPHESRIGDRPFTQYFVAAVDGFVAMSQAVLDDISRFDTNKPRLLSPHPIFDNFGDRQSTEIAVAHLGLPLSYRYMMFFGFVRDYKGLDILLDAYADPVFRESNIRLIIAGEYYSNKDKYHSQIDRLGLREYIYEFDQFIADSEVAHYFNASDLIVQPYKTATQSGVTQIAYHFEKPMIVTDVGGLSEMCPDGKVGYVVPPSPADIKKAILRYFDETDHEAMHKSIIEEKKKYSWRILVDNIMSLRSRL